jgi:hypothetical protein
MEELDGRVEEPSRLGCAVCNIVRCARSMRRRSDDDAGEVVDEQLGEDAD